MIKSNNPLVSTIIPCYNSSRYVAEAIQSALDQTYEHKEVVVIDDGSTDGSLDVIRSFGDRIRWESGPNRGACAARNRGLELARGKLIQFLDADDLLHPEKLKRMVPLAEQADGMVFSDGLLMGDQNRRHQLLRSRTVDSDDPVLIMAHRGPLTPAPLHRRENLEHVGGFSTGLRCSQDRDLHMRMACEGISFSHFPDALYFVRRTPGSVSELTLRVKDQHLGIVTRAAETLRSKGTLTEERAEALAGMLAMAARAYARAGRYRKALKYVREAKHIHPTGGYRIAFPGRAGRVAPRAGFLPAEWLTEVDDSIRWLLALVMPRRTFNPL